MFSTKTDLALTIGGFLLGALPVCLIAFIAWEHIPAYRNYLSWSYSGWRLALLPPAVFVGAAWAYISERA